MIATLVVFAAVTVFGPLAFGAVDRVVQVVLVALLALGLWLHPPLFVPLGRRGSSIAMALIGILVLKEFLPHQWFGVVRWRTEAQGIPGLQVSAMHHPEPARALDALLCLLLAFVWVQWVRTMAAQREMRVAMTWILFGAGVMLAVVCFMMPRSGSPTAIYGLRHTPGWTGWGPFPNRNHTASFLVMAAFAGLGCAVWAGMRRLHRLAVFATAGVLLIVVAMLVGKSRGGLVALAAGLAVFCALMLWRHRSRRTLALVIGGLALAGVMVVIFGGQLLERFTSQESGHVSTQLRRDIWKNAVTMWRDAPLFGHGADSFTGLFPFYQRLSLDDIVVLHPESSWLQWLCEMGLVPVVILSVLAGRLVFLRLGQIFQRRGTFYLSAGALAGLAAVVAHSAIDVPGHRWGTAGFALALLALACPVSREMQLVGKAAPRAALAPLVVAAWWSLPFLGFTIPWQPVSLVQLRAREESGALPRPSVAEWERALRHFPLEPVLHHFLAMRELESGSPKTSEWQKHIEIVHRLQPGSWTAPINHARVVKRLSPALCIQYWQLGISRSGWRAEEILGRALADTSGMPAADWMWPEFISTHPSLALAYARTLPPGETRPYFDVWWKTRAAAKDVAAGELKDFYAMAARWASEEQVEEWMKLHPERRREDWREWAALLHKVGMDERAWQLLMGRIEKPAYPAATGHSKEEIEARARIAPENVSNLMELARERDYSGDSKAAGRIVFDAASKPGAQSWFLRKAAWLLAEEGKFSEAVEMALRDK